MRFAPLVLLLFIIAGCRSVVYVPVPTASSDSSYVSRDMRDTVFIHDSVAVTERGDTVVKERVRMIYRTRQLTDTVFSNRVDTVTMVSTVENKPQGVFGKPWWIVWCVTVAMAFVVLLFVRRR